MSRKAPVIEGSSEIDITEILARIPHRFPFLLVDRVIGIRGDEFGIGSFIIPTIRVAIPGVAIEVENLGLDTLLRGRPGEGAGEDGLSGPDDDVFVHLDRLPCG